MTKPLELRLLGHVQISYGGLPVTGFVSNKSQALLCYLAVTRQPHTRDDLAVLLWSDMPEAEAKANLRVALCNLRRLLPDHIIADRKTVALNPASTHLVDVASFEDQMEQYDSSESTSIYALHRAVELYQGDLLHGLHPRGALLFEEWLLLKREHLRQKVMQSYYTLAAHHLQRAEYAEALACTNSLLKLEPWHEEAHRQAMLLYALSGQRRLALAQYKTCREILRQEFGVEPEEETTTLYERIKDDTVSLSTAPKPATSGTAEGLPALPLRPLVGRADEFGWLMAQYEQAREGRGALTLIRGATGSGKTTLAEEILCFIGVSGGLLLKARCRDFSRAVPYQPVVDLLRAVLRQAPAAFDALPNYWLHELRQLLPELHRASQLAAAPAALEPLGRQRLFEAVAALLDELARLQGEVVVFLDDMHHADAETVDVLAYLLGRRQSAGVWYVGAYSPELLSASHPLLRLYHNLHRAGRAALLRLGDLGPQAVAQLVGRLEGLDAATAGLLADRLYAQAGGNPLLTALLLEDLVERGVLCLVRGSWWLNLPRLIADPGSVPPPVQALFEERVDRLPAESRALIQLAAMIGQSFDAGMLARCGGVHLHEVTRQLVPLLAHQLVREVDGAASPSIERLAEVRYSFVSSLAWAAILGSLSPRERHLLSEQVSRVECVPAPRRDVRTPRRHSAARKACHRRVSHMLRPELLID